MASKLFMQSIATVLMKERAKGVEFLSISEHMERYNMAPEDHEKACEEIGELVRTAKVAIWWATST